MANTTLLVTLTLCFFAVPCLLEPIRCQQSGELLRIFEEFIKGEKPIEFGNVWTICNEDDLISALRLVGDQLVVIAVSEFHTVDIEFYNQLSELAKDFPEALVLATVDDVIPRNLEKQNVEKFPVFAIVKNVEVIAEVTGPDYEALRDLMDKMFDSVPGC